MCVPKEPCKRCKRAPLHTKRDVLTARVAEWSADRAQEELDYRLEMNQITQDDLNQEILEIEEKMSEMKAHLQRKLGDQVMLDDEENEDDTADDLSEGSGGAEQGSDTE